MNKKTIIAVLIVAMLTSCVTAFADTDIEYKQAGDKLALTGTTDAEDASAVFVDIFPKGKYLDSDGNFDVTLAYDALEEAVDRNSVLVYTNQTEVNKGGYSFNIRFVRYPGLSETETVSGIYTAVIKCGDDTVTKDILYVLPGERDDALLKLADIKNEAPETRKSSVSEFLRMNKFSLGIYCEEFDTLSVSKLNDMLYAKTEEYNYSIGDGVDYIKDLKKLVAVQILNEGKVSNIDALKEELGLTSTSYDKWYMGKIVDSSFKSALTNKLSEKNISSTGDFDKKLKEALTLIYNEKSDGIDHIKGIFEAFKGDFGITKSFSDDAYRSVSGETYSSFTSLADALDSYKEETGGTSSGTSGGKNSGGGVKVYTPGASSAPVVTPPASASFSDVPNNHWAQTAIYALRDKGIIAGKTQTAFCPDDNITREEFVKLVTAMSGVELADGELPFADADSSAWYAKYLASAYKFGIIKGSDDGSFGVGRFITRQDIAVMLVRALELKGVQISETEQKAEFTDAYNVSEYALAAVNKLKEAGVISGYTDGSVKPMGLASRAEAAQMIYKAMLLIK